MLSTFKTGPTLSLQIVDKMFDNMESDRCAVQITLKIMINRLDSDNSYLLLELWIGGNIVE